MILQLYNLMFVPSCRSSVQTGLTFAHSAKVSRALAQGQSWSMHDAMITVTVLVGVSSIFSVKKQPEGQVRNLNVGQLRDLTTGHCQ